MNSPIHMQILQASLERIVAMKSSISSDGGDCKNLNPNFSSLVSQALDLAGVPRRGPEATAMCIFILKKLLALPMDATTGDISIEITWTEYFQLLTDEGLRWYEIVSQIFPYLTLPTAVIYLTKMVEFASSEEMSCDDSEKSTSTGLMNVCIGGLTLALDVFLDLIVVAESTGPNDAIDEDKEADLATVVSLLNSCCNILFDLNSFQAMWNESSTCSEEFKAAANGIFVLVVLACPVLSEHFVCSHVAKYLNKTCDVLSSVEETEVDDELKLKRKKMSLKQQALANMGQRLECVMVGCVMIDTHEAASECASVEDRANKNISDKEINCESSLKQKSNQIKNSCHKVVSQLKLMFAEGMYTKIISLVCLGPVSESNSSTYQILRQIAASKDNIAIGHHMLHITFLSDLVFTLLNIMTQPNTRELSVGAFGVEIYGCLRQELLKCSTQQRQDNKMDENRGNEGNTCSLNMPQLFHGVQIFPNDMLHPELSDIDKILMSQRSLGTEADLALLHRAVRDMERGWRDLIALGLWNVDFDGWWKNGFFQLFWSYEECLCTEKNVLLVLRALCYAKELNTAGQCSKSAVQDMKKLLSVMFKRLPHALQERVVLAYLGEQTASLNFFDLSDEVSNNKNTGLDTENSGSDLIAEDECSVMYHQRDVPNPTTAGVSQQREVTKGFFGVNKHTLSDLEREDDVSSELILILNKLTLANADQMTSYMLYKCLFQPTLVISHLVYAAITTNGQTESAIRVLRNMSSVCKMPDLNTPGMSSVCKMPDLNTPGMSSVCKMPDHNTPGMSSVCKMPDLNTPGMSSVCKMADLNTPGMSSVCKMADLNTPGVSLLLGCILKEIPKIELGEKEIQNLSQFFSLALETYVLNVGDGRSPDGDVVMKGILTLDDILSHFVYTSLCVSDESCGDRDENQFDSQEAASNDETSGKHPEPKLLSLDVSLLILEMLLEKAAKENDISVLEFQPVPLLLSLCDCYADNYHLLVKVTGVPQNTAGDLLLSQARKSLRLATYCCISRVLELVAPVWDRFTTLERNWLIEEACMSGWVHAALLAPLLSQEQGQMKEWELVFEEISTSIKQAPHKSTARLVYLMQIGLMNDSMLSLVTGRLSSLHHCLPQANLVVTLKWILQTAMPSEMERLVRMLQCLLQGSPSGVTDIKQDDSGQTESISKDPSTTWLLCASECLRDAVLLLDEPTESLSVRCHAASNYQQTIQHLVKAIPASGAASLLSTICCHICMALSTEQDVVDHTPVEHEMRRFDQILQVTAMDVIGRIKSLAEEAEKMSKSNENKKKKAKRRNRPQSAAVNSLKDGRTHEVDCADTTGNLDEKIVSGGFPQTTVVSEEFQKDIEIVNIEDTQNLHSNVTKSLLTHTDAGGEDNGSKTENKRENFQDRINTILDCISCVQVEAVRSILEKQLIEIIL